MSTAGCVPWSTRRGPTCRRWRPTSSTAATAATLVWLGRRAIPGIEPGRELNVRGRVALRDGRKVIYNPYYELEIRRTDGDAGTGASLRRPVPGDSRSLMTVDEQGTAPVSRMSADSVAQPAGGADDDRLPSFSEQLADQLGGVRGLVDGHPGGRLRGRQHPLGAAPGDHRGGRLGRRRHPRGDGSAA